MTIRFLTTGQIQLILAYKIGEFTMIPKIIHYCWLSGEPYPDEIAKCIESWHKYLPEYEYKLWTKNNFDLEINPWVKEAFEKKKYAAVSDFIRLKVLYDYGGIYLDSDLEVLRPLDDLLSCKAFTGRESAGRLAAWVFGAEPKNTVIKMFMDDYKGRHFLNEKDQREMVPNTISVTRILSSYGIGPEDETQTAGDITVFSSDYFSPYKPWKKKLDLTSNSYMKHHYAGSWKNTTDAAFWTFMQNIPDRISKILDKYDSDCKFIIYGFGIAASVTFDALKAHGATKRIKCFAVSEYDTAWREIYGIPLVQISDLDFSNKNNVFLIATPPKYHTEIKNNLLGRGFENIENMR